MVITEKQRRDSELEHKHILEECSRVMEEYRITERKLRSHIIKSRSIGAGEGRLHNSSAEMSQLCMYFCCWRMHCMVRQSGQLLDSSQLATFWWLAR